MVPIEYGFNVYKAYLKHYVKGYDNNEWFELHVKAYQAVNRDIAIKEFRKCDVPLSLSFDILTSDEMRSVFKRICLA